MTQAKLLDIVSLWARDFERMDIDWAIGGVAAMAAQGYVREAPGLEVYFGDHNHDDVMAYLRKKHIAIVDVEEPFRYAIIPDSHDEDERVDLLFSSIEPDVSAVAVPDTAVLGGSKLPVWPMVLIVTAKLMSEEQQDLLDLRELSVRGLFDKQEVLKILEHLGELEAMDRLQALVAAAPRRRPRG